MFRVRTRLRTGFAGGGGGEPIVPTTGKLVANRFQMATATATITAPFTSMRSHWMHSDGEVTDIKCFESNRFLLNTTTASGGGSHTRKKYIEYPAGVFHQVKWAAATTIALTASTRVVSDVVVSSVTGLPLVIPAGTKFWERTVITVGVAIACPVFPMPAACDVLGLDDGNAASDLGNSGTIAPTTGLNTFGSQGMIGTVNATGAKSYVVLGDSLDLGQGDITSVSNVGGSGWIARALDVHGYPYMKWALGGQEATEQAALITSINADLAQIGFTNFVCQSGINDLRLNRTEAQIKADYQTIYGMSNVVGKTIQQCTLGPRSTSTDGWATTANQTPQTDGNMAALTSLNTAIRAGLPNVTGIIDYADGAMSARDSNIHKAPPAGTADGTHLDSTRAALVASLVVVA